jgi:hypothetical protein
MLITPSVTIEASSFPSALGAANAKALAVPNAIVRNSKLSTTEPTMFEAMTARPKCRWRGVYTPMSSSSATKKLTPEATATAGLTKALNSDPQRMANAVALKP